MGRPSKASQLGLTVTIEQDDEGAYRWAITDDNGGELGSSAAAGHVNVTAAQQAARKWVDRHFPDHEVASDSSKPPRRKRRSTPTPGEEELPMPTQVELLLARAEREEARAKDAQLEAERATARAAALRLAAQALEGVE